MKALALLAIKGYQRFISPRKGYSCAYRVHTGYQSCSSLGYRAIRRYGLFTGLGVLNGRFDRCAAANFQFHQSQHLHHQRGYCDVPACDIPSCDLPSCDLPSCHFPSHCSDFANCGNSPSSCGSTRYQDIRRYKPAEKYVYIPPNSMKKDR